VKKHLKIAVNNGQNGIYRAGTMKSNRTYVCSMPEQAGVGP